MVRRTLSRAALALTLLQMGIARADPVAVPPPDCEHQPEDPRCPEHPVPPPKAPARSQPAEAPRASGGGNLGNLNVGSCGGGGGSGDGVAILFAAVVGAALLPVVVFALDDDAKPEATARWSNLSARVLLYGGGVSASDSTGGASLGGARVTAGYGLLGADASAESAFNPARYSTADATLVLRLPPKDHVELGVAAGGRMLRVNGAEMAGYEIAVPHRYLFGELFSQRVALDVRPSVAADAHDLALTLEAGLQIPLPGPVSARLSGRVWSLNHDIEVGGLGGLEVAL